MDTSAITSIGDTSYLSLTSPFLLKKVAINSHTPYDGPKYEDESISRWDFPQVKSTYSRKLHLKSYNVGVINLSDSSADLVKNMIADGYEAKNALDIDKAVRAYGLNALGASGMSSLSNNVYEA